MLSFKIRLTTLLVIPTPELSEDKEESVSLSGPQNCNSKVRTRAAARHVPVPKEYLLE